MKHKKSLKNKSPFISSYTPSEQVRTEAQRLREEYEDVLTPKHIDMLSRNMGLESKGRNQAANEFGERMVEDEENLRLGRSAMKSLRLSAGLQTAAGQISSIPKLLEALAKGEPLERKSARDTDHPDLLSFFRNPLHESLPAPIVKCIDTTRNWCIQQLEALDEQVNDLTASVKRGGSPRELERIQDILRDFDRTSGMLHEVGELMDNVSQEINKSVHRGSSRKGPGAA